MCRSQEKPQNPHPPRKVPGLNCLSANACGRRLSLHFIALQGCTSFHHLTFHSVHCQPPPRLPTQECFHSFHCAHAYPPFHSAPLWLSYPTFRNSKPKREATFHPPQFAPLHSVTTLAFPHANQRYALRSVHP